MLKAPFPMPFIATILTTLIMVAMPSGITLAADNSIFLGRTISQWESRLADANERVRLEAVVALVQVGSPATSELLSALNHKEPAVRHWAAVGLGQIGSRESASPDEREKVIAVLKPCLKDAAATVRISAAHALARCQAIDLALPVLVDALKDPIDGARIQAASALLDLGEAARPVLSALVAAKDDKTDYVVRLATRAVAKLNEK